MVLTIVMIFRRIVRGCSLRFFSYMIFDFLVNPPCEPVSSEDLAPVFKDAAKGTKTLSVSLDYSLITRIESDAKVSGCSKSQIVNALIELGYHRLDDYFERQRNFISGLSFSSEDKEQLLKSPWLLTITDVVIEED